MSLSITENTLLKLLVRRGSNLQRQNVVLSEGELGYTIDSKRLFVGDGSTNGGSVAGNIFYGIADGSNASTEKNQLASFSVRGDTIYDINTSLFYIVTAANGTANANYFPIGGPNIVQTDNITITKNSSGVLSLLPLSANALDSKTLRGGLSAVNNTLQLGPTIYANTIGASSLTIPGIFTIGATQFNIATPLTNPGMLYWSSGTVTTRPIPNTFTFINPINILAGALGVQELNLFPGISTFTVTAATSSVALSGFPEGTASVQLYGQHNVTSGRIVVYIQSDYNRSANSPVTFELINSSANADSFNACVPLSGIPNNTALTFNITVSTNAASGTFNLSAVGVGY